MAGKLFAPVIALLVVFCPVICGSQPLLHVHVDSAPAEDAPHVPHDSCSLDQCFCNSPSVPSQGASITLGTAVAPVCACLHDSRVEAGVSFPDLPAVEPPPRSLDPATPLPLLI
jgi:hypothetical protein